MSRVDEAMRRAAEQAQAAGSSASDLLDPTLPAVDEHAGVAFPTEGGPAERSPAVEPTAAATPAAAPRMIASAAVGEEDPGGTADPSEPVMPEKAMRGLFERLDPRLAERVIADLKMAPIPREQYRRIAAALHDAQLNEGLKVVMMASALSGEGKTLTAANLALTLSESYHRRVLLIDADLRRPDLHNLFRLNATTGLCDGIEPNSAHKILVRQVTERLSVLPAGRPTVDPMALLTSKRMRQLVAEAREAFDWVIIDTPPLMLLPDANLLAAIVERAVLVVKAESTPHEMVRRSVEAIGREKIIGVVLNGAAGAAEGHHYSYYHHYHPRPTAAGA